MREHKDVAISEDSERDFEAALEQFQRLLDVGAIDRMQPLGPAAVYTTLVTVWLLVHQRLNAGASLEHAVTHFIKSNPELVSGNRRVREKTLSANTSAYSRARTRLRPEVTDWLANHIFESLVATFPASLCERRVFILDGTTIPLAPTAALRAAFPPASNQHGKSVWPIAHLLVAHELESGCAMLPEVGAKFGPEAMSEGALTKLILVRLPPRSLLLADRNFGIFGVAHASVQAGHDVLFRLTEKRFQSLARRAKPLASNIPGQKSWQLNWQPSTKDRKTHAEIPADAHVDVRLHEIVLSDSLTLWLVTTLDYEPHVLADLYNRRLNVESDIRDVKVTLRTEEVRGKSVKMLRKELATSIIAYNLVVQVRRLAAKLANVPPRRLSFTGVWTAVRVILLESAPWNTEPTATEWRAKFEKVLDIASQRKLPNRPNRSYPRKAHPKRSKSNSGNRKPNPK